MDMPFRAEPGVESCLVSVGIKYGNFNQVSRDFFGFRKNVERSVSSLRAELTPYSALSFLSTSHGALLHEVVLVVVGGRGRVGPLP